MSKAIPNIIKNVCSTNMNSVLTLSTILGTLFSSAAQICAIHKNSEYTENEKKYMKKQEIFDAGLNIGTYVLVTLSIMGLATKAVSTGKFTPKPIMDYLEQNGLFINKAGENIKGTWDCNIGKLFKKFVTDNPNNKMAEQYFDEYKVFKDSVKSIATIGSAIISSTTFVPYFRNKFASIRHNRELEKSQMSNPVIDNPVLNKPEPVAKQPETKPSVAPVSRTFEDYRSRVHGMRI